MHSTSRRKKEIIISPDFDRLMKNEKRAASPSTPKSTSKAAKAGSSSSPATSMTREERLQQLRQRIAQSSNANRQEIVAEHQRAQIHPNAIQRLERKRKQAERTKEKLEATEQGIDIQRQRNLKYTAEEVEAWNAKQQQKQLHRKSHLDAALDYAKASMRRQEKLLDKLPADVELAGQQSDQEGWTGVDFRPSEDGLQRVAQSVLDVQESRAKQSKYRRENPSDDITFINENNKRFNDKLERVYGKYTEEYKDAFERGTAL